MNKSVLVKLILSYFCFVHFSCTDYQKVELTSLENKDTRILNLETNLKLQNTKIDSLKQLLQYSQIDLNSLRLLAKSASLTDKYNYLVLALFDWRDKERHKVFAMPIMLVSDSVLVNNSNINFRENIRKYFNDKNRYFSIDFGGQFSGIIKAESEYRPDVTTFELVVFDSNLTAMARKSHRGYLTIGSTLFPVTDMTVRKRYGNANDKNEAKKVAFKELKSKNININSSEEIELIDLQIINPKGDSSKYAFSVSRYYEPKKANKEQHYLSLFYPLNEDKYRPIFRKHTHADSNSYFGSRSYFFLELIDYDFDGNDEFLIIESGYEHRDVILYKKSERKLIEIYRIAISSS